MMWRAAGGMIVRGEGVGQEEEEKEEGGDFKFSFFFVNNLVLIDFLL